MRSNCAGDTTPHQDLVVNRATVRLDIVLSRRRRSRLPRLRPGVPAAARHLDIAQYRVEGVHLLTEGEVGKAVYPFLGPDRTTDDVEKARAAPEKAYNAKG